jgi:hypothetical protein
MLEMAAVSFPPSLAVGARLQKAFRPWWHVGVELAAPSQERVEAQPDGGEARARTFELHGQLSWGPELGRVRPYFGPTLFALFERGYTTAPLDSTTQYRVLGGAAVELGLSIQLADAWSVLAFGSAGRSFIQTGTFAVGAADVLDGRGWIARAGLGLGRAF